MVKCAAVTASDSPCKAPSTGVYGFADAKGHIQRVDLCNAHTHSVDRGGRVNLQDGRAVFCSQPMKFCRNDGAWRIQEVA